jgi:hypothetical protein
MSQNLPESCINTSIVENNSTELSIYFGQLTGENILVHVKRILQAFPNVTNSFIDLLIERAKENHFSDKRLTDAVNNTIDNCIYPVPTLANFLSWDKKVKLYSYSEICDIVYGGSYKCSDFTRIKIKNIFTYVKNIDKIKYNIPDEL